MKSISFAMLLVGTIVGAGFASGSEILVFFGSEVSLEIVPVCGVLVFAVSALFLFVGKRARAGDISAVNGKILGKAHVAADIFLLFNSLVVLAGMLAGMDSLFGMVLPIAPAYSVISGILCALVVSRGLKGLIKGNLIAIPFMIAAILLICCFAFNPSALSYPFRWLSLPAAFVYVSMNMMLAAAVLTTVHSLSARQILLSSALAAVMISGLLFAIIAALNSADSMGSMPLLSIAQGISKPLFYASIAALCISIFTTMMMAMSGLNTWLSSLVGGRLSPAIVLLAGLILSNLGFEGVVGFLYPIIGVVGLVYIGASAVYLVRSRNDAIITDIAIAKTQNIAARNTAKPKTSSIANVVKENISTTVGKVKTKFAAVIRHDNSEKTSP